MESISGKMDDPLGTFRLWDKRRSIFVCPGISVCALKRGDFPGILCCLCAYIISGKQHAVSFASLFKPDVSKAGFPVCGSGAVSAGVPVSHRTGGQKMAVFSRDMGCAGGVTGVGFCFPERVYGRFDGGNERGDSCVSVDYGEQLCNNQDMVSLL